MDIYSKTYGKMTVLFDEDDRELVERAGNGSGVWCVIKQRNTFYAQKRFGDTLTTNMHRLITGAGKGEYVDHINGNGLDNRRSNLRICKNSSNIRNGKVRTNNLTGVNGVSYDVPRGKWKAQIKVNFKGLFLGRYDTFEEACSARFFAESIYWDD